MPISVGRHGFSADSAARSRAAATTAAPHGARSRLLLLVYLISLLLLLTLGGGLAILASAHVASAAIGASASADRALAEAIVDDLGSAVTDDAPSTSTAARVERVLRRAIEDVGLRGIALGAPDGTVRSTVGPAELPAGALSVPGGDRPEARLVGGAEGQLLVETFPVLLEGRVVAVIGLVRDGEPLLASAAAAQRDIAFGTAAGASVLVVVLFAVFRGAERRIDRQTEQLLESTRRDPLTGLLTHAAAIGAVADTLRGEDDKPVALALLDIDNFQRMNDTHGHEFGDVALLAVATNLEEAVGPSAILGRSGPDEFLVAVPGQDAGQLTATVDDVRRRLAGVVLHTDAGDRLPLTVSVGIGVAPLHGRSSTELLSTVAMALGEARSAGGDQVIISRLSFAELAEERRASFTILDGLINAIDTRDRYTRRHSEDVARYALFLARELGIDDETQAALHHAALLHDVGKIAVPDDILRKPGQLTRDEMEVMKQHVALGGVLVRDLANADLVAEGVRLHHEWWDGNGYPEGLAGEEIPLIARIIAVADTYSAITTSRPYRRAIAPRDALGQLAAAAGTQLDPRLVDVFVLAMESQAEPPLPSDARQPSFWLAPVPST
jgi:diguanylate cyclase (GGDEF)-like protein/putative nucleotidyltransferase with HDIG domain